MRRYSKLAVVIMAMIPLAVLLAMPSVTLIHPEPDQYYLEALWNVVLVNPDQDTHRVWLEGEILEMSKDRVFRAVTDSFSLPPGVTRIGYRDIKVRRSTYAPGYETIAEGTGGLPAGDYGFAVWLMPYGASSSFSFEVRPAGPPRLTSPKDGETIAVARPLFVWKPPMPVPAGRLTYRFALAEILPGQSPAEAMAANPKRFEQQDIAATTLSYPVSAKALDFGKTFAWQVTAVSGQTLVGTSEIRSFAKRKGAEPLPKSGPDATIVWQHQAAADEWDIVYSDFNASDNTASWPLALTALPGYDLDPAIAYDRNGNAMAVWSHREPGLGQLYRIYWSRRPTGGTWSIPQPLTTGTPAWNEMDPALALDENGTGLCLWVVGGSGPNPATYLLAAFWNGIDWSPSEWLGAEVLADDTCRLPEITFAAAPAAGVSFKTVHQAVAVVTLGNLQPSRMGCIVWDGSSWGKLKVLSAAGPVGSSPYAYADGVPMPENAHNGGATTVQVSITALSQQPEVCVAWTLSAPNAGYSLWTGKGSWAGSWSWGAPVKRPSGSGFMNPAVVADKSGKLLSVFCKGSDAAATTYWASEAMGNCTQLSTGTAATLPALAWISGTQPGALATWSQLGAAGHDICWSWWDGKTWTKPAMHELPGSDLNPDVAARTGSHTMPSE